MKTKYTVTVDKKTSVFTNRDALWEQIRKWIARKELPVVTIKIVIERGGRK